MPTTPKPRAPARPRRAQPSDAGAPEVTISNPGKVLYPAAGFTKADVADYYTRIAPLVLPHLAGRALSLKRYPDGVDKPFFYEKRCPVHRPGWVRTQTVASKRHGTIDFCQVDSVATLRWLANLACLELHPYLATEADPARPTHLVFDLDPGPPAGALHCVRAALTIRDLLAGIGLSCLVKTSGGKGLHLLVPLNTPVGFDETKAFARAVAMAMERTAPDYVTSSMAKEQRGGRVFVDWSQNDAGKTTVCVYSLRAQQQPTVSAPIPWAELERARKPEDLVFTAQEVLAGLDRGDPFAEALTLRQRLPTAAEVIPADAAQAPSGRAAAKGAATKPARPRQPAPDAEPAPAARSRRRPTTQSTGAAGGLETYRAKRDFSRSPEPSGAAPAKAHAQRYYCIHKHLASHLHYDFRLEHRGVLLSWAVPKGPSLDPAVKRLAMQVEDHPLDYGSFEGVIPSGYGAGIVMLWDKGSWQPLVDDVDAAIAKGHLPFTIAGTKLHGAWNLIRTARGDERSWLLIKQRDDAAGPDDIAALQPRSVASGEDLAGILARERNPPWDRHGPVAGGETGKLFDAVIAQAAALRSRGPARAARASRPAPRARQPRPSRSRR
jgi:bifunctional non-homologous end joining protein LigD